MRARSACRCCLGLAHGVEQRRGDEAHLVHERWPICCDRLDRDAVEDVEQVACNGLPILRHLVLVQATLQRQKQLIPVLLNDEAHELLL